MLEKAINLLNKELEKEHSPMVPAVPIINYLISKCGNDEEFAERIVLENKSIKECFEYVLQEVKKKLNNKNGWIDDPEVYGMAEYYYLSDENLIEKPEPKVMDVPKTTTNNRPKVKKSPERNQLSLFDM